MLIKMFGLFAIVVAALVIGHQQRVFHGWGVVGSCQSVRSPSGDTGSWYACTEGLLTGYPSLLGDGCTYEMRTRGYEYWRCPVPRDRS
jgi:hypothetical protein